MSKRPGRPKKANPLEKRISLNVTPTHFFVIQHKAAKAGLAINEFIRQATINSQIKPLWNNEEMDIFKKLVMMSNDIRQMVMTAKNEGASSLVLYFEKYRGHIDYAIKRLNEGQIEKKSPK